MESYDASRYRLLVGTDLLLRWSPSHGCRTGSPRYRGVGVASRLAQTFDCSRDHLRKELGLVSAHLKVECVRHETANDSQGPFHTNRVRFQKTVDRWPTRPFASEAV